MVKLLHLMMLLWATEMAPADDELDEQEEAREEKPNEDESDDAEGAEELTDPRDYLGVKNEHKKMASLQDHINRLHRKTEQQAAYITQLEGGAKPNTDDGALNAARLEVAFMRSTWIRHGP